MQNTFGSSKLVRQLAPWAPVEAGTWGGDVAERMSRWFGPVEAIQLLAAHQSLNGPTALKGQAGGKPPKTPSAQALAQDVQRVRGVLAQAIAQDPLAHVADDAGEPGYAPWHQRHLDLQRQMAQMVGALRDHVRQGIAAASPRLRQLAALDAAFEELLAPREQALLPTAATVLERRFLQLRAAHRQEAAADAEAQEQAARPWRQAGGWLDTFAQEWREALLAELALRLEPVVGMAQALRNESGHQA